MAQLLIVALLVAAGSAYFWTRGTSTPSGDATSETAPEAAVEEYRDRINESLQQGADRLQDLDPENPQRER